jgi:hypothetical protein
MLRHYYRLFFRYQVAHISYKFCSISTSSCLQIRFYSTKTMAKSDEKYDYDYFVIGGGSGGVRSSRIAAQHGARVALAEAKKLGKTFNSNFTVVSNICFPRWYLCECWLCTKEIILLCLTFS